MQGSRAAAWAGFALGCGLLLRALPHPAGEPAACPQPVLREPAVIVCAPEVAPRPRLTGPTRRLFGLPIDPNRAAPETLETLPGIGPARARAIVAERARRPFASPADLQRVHGLGPLRVAALAPHLDFPGPQAGRGEASAETITCRSTCGSAPDGAASGETPPEAAGEGP